MLLWSGKKGGRVSVMGYFELHYIGHGGRASLEDQGLLQTGWLRKDSEKMEKAEI